MEFIGKVGYFFFFIGSLDFIFECLGFVLFRDEEVGCSCIKFLVLLESFVFSKNIFFLLLVV